MILLSSSSQVLDELRQRDPDAAIIANTGAVLSTLDAIVRKATLDALYSQNPNRRNVSNVFRSEHELPNGFRLRIVHDTQIMGPPTFLAIAGNHWCPWGVWTLYKGQANFTDVAHITMHEAIDAYYAARDFTYHYSPHHTAYAKLMNYVLTDQAKQ